MTVDEVLKFLSVVGVFMYIRYGLSLLREKSNTERQAVKDFSKDIVAMTPEEIKEAEEKIKEAELRRELKKQGYTDELIAVIIPIINDK